MLATTELIPLIGSVMNQVAAEIESLNYVLEAGDLERQINELQLASTIANRMTECASSLSAGNLVTSFGASALQCVNAAVQIGLAVRTASLQSQLIGIEGEVAKTRATDRIAQLAGELQTAGIRTNELREQIDARLAAIENLRIQARSNLAKAVYLASWQSEKQAEVTRAAGTIAAAKQYRYTQALTNAKKMAFLAKRAIEQRLGISLSEMRYRLPLVGTPSAWESRVCTMTGINYDAIAGRSGDADAFGEGWRNFTEGFIGDYVTNLENLIESFRIEHPFKEGRDIATISLRDDVMNVRRSCQVDGRNLLLQAGQLDEHSTWYATGCIDEIDGEAVTPHNCIDTLPLGGSPNSTVDPALSGAQGYELRFGDGEGCPAGEPLGPCSWQPGAALVQDVRLEPGRYRLTWYTEEAEGSGGATLAMVHVAPLDESISAPSLSEEFFPAYLDEDWNRMAAEFFVDEAGIYQIGFGTDAASLPTETVTVAAPMLETLPGSSEDFVLKSFQNTHDDTLVTMNVCEDTDGSIFRHSKWSRDCVRLCPSGLSNNCADGPVHCYREASFGVAQSWIENGQLFNYSGFARGNYNYRIESIGLNFVGTGIRDCGSEQLKQACYGAGFVPYTLLHQGPFFVRNHYGDDFRAHLFDGRIEHARGLATERYITNPLSSEDRDLLSDYMREELQGRPLDGNFVIRVWEEPGADFEAIEDVQIVLNYRYWTRSRE